jgi:hypothetical protein
MYRTGWQPRGKCRVLDQASFRSAVALESTVGGFIGVGAYSDV